jgi:hypothetical protein
MMRRLWKPGSGAIILALTITTAQAEITGEADNGFAVKHEVTVSAEPAAAYAMIRSPAKWWSKEHTFTLNSDNLYMDAQAGGCLCELIPQKGSEDQVALRGSVQHMRILHAEPGKMLRLSGALGPLQSEAVTGTMTIQLEPIDGGTVITLEYVVGGYMRFPVAETAPAVDKVIRQQASRLAMAIGPLVGGKRTPPASQDENEDPVTEGGDDPSSAIKPIELPASENAKDAEEDSTLKEDGPEAESGASPGGDLLNAMAGIGSDDDAAVPPE